MAVLFKDITQRKGAETAAEQRSAQVRRLAEIAARINTTTDAASVIGVVVKEARHLLDAH